MPVGLQKFPNKARRAGLASSKKGAASKKEGVLTSTAAYQACDLAGNFLRENCLENTKTLQCKPKMLERSAITTPFELQQNEAAGSVNVSQQVVSVDTTFDNNFNGQMPRLETGEVKRRKLSCTTNQPNASEVNINGEELEYSMKARTQAEVHAALVAEIIEADPVIDSSSAAVPHPQIKPHSPKRRNSIALDIATIDTKVRDCHVRGNLKSLTVPELKSFLSASKAKVGGKKEELIQRIISLLSK